MGLASWTHAGMDSVHCPSGAVPVPATSGWNYLAGTKNTLSLSNGCFLLLGVNGARNVLSCFTYAKHCGECVTI